MLLYYYYIYNTRAPPPACELDARVYITSINYYSLHPHTTTENNRKIQKIMIKYIDCSLFFLVLPLIRYYIYTM